MGCQNMIYHNCSLVILVHIQLWSYLKKILNQFGNQAIDRKVKNMDRREWAWSRGLI